MDPLSLPTACAALRSTIATTSLQLEAFVRSVPEARADLEAVGEKLEPLETIVDFLLEDSDIGDKAGLAALERNICGILTNCEDALLALRISLHKYLTGVVAASAAWEENDQDDVRNLSSSLECHKLALGLALETLALFSNNPVEGEGPGWLMGGGQTDKEEAPLRSHRLSSREQPRLVVQCLSQLERQLHANSSPTNSRLQRYSEELRDFLETKFGLKETLEESVGSDSRPPVSEDESSVRHVHFADDAPSAPENVGLVHPRDFPSEERGGPEYEHGDSERDREALWLTLGKYLERRAANSSRRRETGDVRPCEKPEQWNWIEFYRLRPHMDAGDRFSELRHASRFESVLGADVGAPPE